MRSARGVRALEDARVCAREANEAKAVKNAHRMRGMSTHVSPVCVF